VIGVTGTKGKTTVVELLHEILNERAKAASLSSLRFRIGDKVTLNDKKMTMPGRFFVQQFLHKARKSGCKYAVLEVTSEGIKQFRHRFIKFDIAIMTNVAPEHIEAHGSFEKYLRAKLDLFWRTQKNGIAIINRDDPQKERFAAATAARKIWYGKNGVRTFDRQYHISDLSWNEEGIIFDINGVTIRSSLQGGFNFYNILAAVALGLSQHISLEKIAARAARVSEIPGRMEFIQREPFAVVVDYAHTPDSLQSVYQTIQQYVIASDQRERGNPEDRHGLRPRDDGGRRIICVLGSAGGGRDKWKRPEMGKIAAEFCDEIILTNEDPYDENPAQILSEIKSGITSNQLLVTKEILDRREAIRHALKSAQKGDVVIISGKGAEPWIMSSGGVKIPWDERVIVKEELDFLSKI